MNQNIGPFEPDREPATVVSDSEQNNRHLCRERTNNGTSGLNRKFVAAQALGETLKAVIAEVSVSELFGTPIVVVLLEQLFDYCLNLLYRCFLNQQCRNKK